MKLKIKNLTPRVHRLKLAPLTRVSLKERVVKMHEGQEKLSMREIGKALSISHTFVEKLLEEHKNGQPAKNAE